MSPSSSCQMSMFFFFNDTATTEIYTLSLHDALPISHRDRPQPAEPPDHQHARRAGPPDPRPGDRSRPGQRHLQDRKSTRLNSSHANISYAVFCLKKKKKNYLLLSTHLSILHIYTSTQ